MEYNIKMYIRESILFVFFFSSVFCEECVRYDFEENFESLFNQEGICKSSNYESWKNGNYSPTGIPSPNTYTSKFVSPQVNMSCASSFPFMMSEGGKVEVNFFIDSPEFIYLARLYVFAEEIVPDGNNPEVGLGVYSSWDLNYQSGWHTISFHILGNGTFNGHIILLGSEHTKSTLLVDSFIYKPPGYMGNCWSPSPTTEVPTTQPITETESSTDNEIKPTTVEVTKPTTVKETKPTTVEVTEPTTVEETKPTTVEVTEPTTVEETKPTTVEVTEPTTVEETKPTTVEVTEPTTVKETEPTTVAATETTTVMETKPTTTTERVQTSVPIIVTNPPTTLTPELQCPEDPHVHWLLPHNEDCGLFYYCVWGSKVLTECPVGLHFNPILQVCDWPNNAGCTSGQ